MTKEVFTKEQVVAEAHRQYKRPVCLDELGEAMQCDTLAEAVAVILIDSAYWDWDPREGNFI